MKVKLSVFHTANFIRSPFGGKMEIKMLSTAFPHFLRILHSPPQAYAQIYGSQKHPGLQGTVKFYQTIYGVIVAADITGLPTENTFCTSQIFGFHIHEGGCCTGIEADEFANTGSHYNPRGCKHPDHAGDMPPLFGANGRAFSVFLTDRFAVDEIVGKTVIIHSGPDDFRTDPSGNSGTKIACGEIVDKNTL